VPLDPSPALSALSDASADARPAPETLAALARAGLAVGELAVSDPGYNRWDVYGWFYCNTPGCRRRALRFWHEPGIGRRYSYADCGTHDGSELDGFALSLAAAVANWRAVTQAEADERDLTQPYHVSTLQKGRDERPL
jgi:hypothetical protein